MLDVLESFEKVLDVLLEEDEWQSLFIDYEKPFVERLWRQCGEFRVNLHRIHPCEQGEALYHPHPWPSAMHVLSGVYETAVGCGIWNERPEFVIKGVISGDFKYEMTRQNGWHYVRPVDRPAMTLMVTGMPWNRPSPKSSRRP